MKFRKRFLFLFFILTQKVVSQGNDEAVIKEHSVLDLDQENLYFQNDIRRHDERTKLGEKLSKMENALLSLKLTSQTKFDQMKSIVESNLFQKPKFKIKLETLDLKI
jgi:hypothetical protein